MLRKQLPLLYLPRIAPRTRVRHVKHIMHARVFAGVVDQANAAGTPFDISLHGIVP